MRLRIFTLAVLIMALTAIPAEAQSDIYDNGPTNGNTDAWQINNGYVVSNSFPFVNNNNCAWWGYQPCSVNGLVFATWMYPGDYLDSAEVSITSQEFGGTTYFDQTINFTQSNCYTNSYGYSICLETGTFQDVYLSTGTYWLNLQNANVPSGDPVYWDENSGPSLASDSDVGTIPSESFTLLGTMSTYCWWCGDHA